MLDTNKQREEFAIEEAREIFEADGETFEEEDLELIEMEGDTEEPGFPVIMLMVAFIKDILDALDFTGIGIIISTIISIIFFVVLLFWIRMRISLGRKLLLKGFWRWFMKRAIIIGVVEFVPFLKILVPGSIFLVLMVHNREKKMVRLFIELLERLEDAGYAKISAAALFVALSITNTF